MGAHLLWATDHAFGDLSTGPRTQLPAPAEGTCIVELARSRGLDLVAL